MNSRRSRIAALNRENDQIGAYVWATVKLLGILLVLACPAYIVGSEFLKSDEQQQLEHEEMRQDLYIWKAERDMARERAEQIERIEKAYARTQVRR